MITQMVAKDSALADADELTDEAEKLEDLEPEFADLADDGEGTVDSSNVGGMSSDARGDSSGVDEALRAWAAGGHAIDEADEDDAIQPVQFAQLEPPAATKVRSRAGRLNNVYVDITVELGRKEMSVNDLIGLKEQDVIDLDKLAGEAFEILINDRPFAEGEIVVVTDLMAVRITRIREYQTPDEEED